MKDLEIRGAGSILGAEQSGHIAGGGDLYVRLVGEAVTAFREAVTAVKKAATSAGGDEVEEGPAEVRVDMPIDANGPHDYISAERLRLDGYRRIGGVTSADDVGGGPGRVDRPAQTDPGAGGEPASRQLAGAGLRR